LWFRRTRLVILAPDPRHPRRAQADNPLNDLSEFSRPPLHALEAAGITLLFLPAYSPDLNPIEMVFAKTKALLRKAASRTVDALWRALGKISQSLTREECVNYFRHCSYGQSG